MKKNLYSLMLIDELVQAVDQLAYQNNTNRSNMVNRILADYFSLPTPEMKMKEVFDCIERLLYGQSAIQVLELPSDSMLTLRTALDYKYRPTLRYALELCHQSGGWACELRISLRSQNRQLLGCLEEFYRCFVGVERRAKEKAGLPDTAQYALEGSKLVRRFILALQSETQAAEQAASAITDFITTFDRAVKGWFDHLGEDRGTEIVERSYQEYLYGGKTVV